MIYLDHSATTKPYKEVCDTVCRALREDFWNPASMYRPAAAVAGKMKTAFASLASDLGCEPSELIQTSCATEASNMALKGLFSRYGTRLNTIIATEADHDATLSTLNYLEQHGARIILLKPLKNGLIDPDDLEHVLDERTLCVSLLWVNNETGVVQDLETLCKVIRRKAPECFIHADMVQAWGKIDFSLQDLDVDLASFSAHKIHGPKGTGLLYKRKKVIPDVLIHGGGQQNGWRSGTENWPLLAGMAKASAMQKESFARRKERVRALNKTLKEGLRHTPAVISFPHALDEIVSVSFPGLRGETLMHMLDEKGVYLSTSSACQAGSKGISHVLKACRMEKKQAEGTLRISLDASNSEEEIKTFIKILEEVLDTLRDWGMYQD